MLCICLKLMNFPLYFSKKKDLNKVYFIKISIVQDFLKKKKSFTLNEATTPKTCTVVSQLHNQEFVYKVKAGSRFLVSASGDF